MRNPIVIEIKPNIGAIHTSLVETGSADPRTW